MYVFKIFPHCVPYLFIFLMLLFSEPSFLLSMRSIFIIFFHCSSIVSSPRILQKHSPMLSSRRIVTYTLGLCFILHQMCKWCELIVFRHHLLKRFISALNLSHIFFEYQLINFFLFYQSVYLSITLLTLHCPDCCRSIQ